MKKLPVGIQSFEQIVHEGYIYLDKTHDIYNLIENGRYYFLSRPRRFGKSLLVSTLRCLFEGKKELFNGLWIQDKWQWEKHPVVMIDFNGIPHFSQEELKTSLEYNLEKIAQEYDIELKAPVLGSKFKELIITLSKKYGSNVVILIDEYDKPIIDHIGKGKERLEIAQDNRDILKSFYGAIKEADVANATRFVLLTGVSKFSQVSIFSELNNLADITMDARYCAMLGVTDEEIGRYFGDRIENIASAQGLSRENALTKLRDYYNGYRFSEEDTKVYNPFSVLRCFDEGRFKNYWFETGTPTFLVNLIKENNYYIPDIENLELRESGFSTYDIEDLRIEPLLFQTGYITIKDLHRTIYTLGYPNQEVRVSFLEILFDKFSGIRDSKQRAGFLKIEEYLEEGDFNSFIEIIKSLFATIEYTIGYRLNEAHFHSLFYLMVSASGVYCHSELLTSTGRIDLAVSFKNRVYIMEFKCDQSSKKAMGQIRSKGYPERFIHTGKDIYLVGINFSTEKKNIEDWEIKKLN